MQNQLLCPATIGKYPLCKINDACEVLGGNVLHHSHDRDEVYRKAIELHPKNFAVLYTGTIPDGTEVVL